MAIDPSKLSAFASAGGPPADEGAMLDEGMEMEEGPEEDGPGKFGNLLTLLEQYAEDVMALTDEFEPEALLDEATELEESDVEALQQGVEGLEDDLKTELGSLSGVALEEARELAQHLADEAIIDDADRLAGWLFRVGQVGLSADDGEGEEEEEIEEEELEEGDPEELDFEE